MWKNNSGWGGKSRISGTRIREDHRRDKEKLKGKKTEERHIGGDSERKKRWGSNLRRGTGSRRNNKTTGGKEIRETKVEKKKKRGGGASKLWF